MDKSESVKRKPGLLERYVELLYRRKIRSILALTRLKKQMSAQEFKFLLEEERKSALARSVTFFILGMIFAYVVIRVILALISPAKADEPPNKSLRKKAFLIGDSQGWLLMHDLPRLAPSGWEIKGAPVPGSSIISWSRNDHANEWAKLKQAKPDVLLVVLGTNDAYMGPRVIKNEYPYFIKLMDKLENVTKNIVWIGPPRLERRLVGAEHFQMMVYGMDGQRLRYLDSAILDLAMWDDKMHCARPNPKGCEQWARWIWSQLE